jgi:hypothetical protein
MSTTNHVQQMPTVIPLQGLPAIIPFEQMPTMIQSTMVQFQLPGESNIHDATMANDNTAPGQVPASANASHDPN